MRLAQQAARGLGVAMLAGSMATALLVPSLSNPALAQNEAPASGAVGQIVYDTKHRAMGTVVDVLTSTKGRTYAVLQTGHATGTERYIIVPMRRIISEGGAMVLHMTASEFRAMPALPHYNDAEGSG